MIFGSLTFVLILITGSSGLSIDIFPNPFAVVNLGGNLTITSKITKTSQETWFSYIFYINSKKFCFTTFSTPPSCNYLFDECPEFGFSCNFTHFNLLITDISLDYHGTAVQGLVNEKGDGSDPPKSTFITTIKVNVPLQDILLTPNGTITKTESETEVFRCFARSLPIASLIWRLSDSLQPTLSPPLTTIDTVTSIYTYTAQKADNGKKLSCTAVYESTPFTEEVLINVLYRPIVTISPSYKPYRVLENTTNLELTCIVTDSNPAVVSFKWKKEGTTTSGNGTYIIPSVYRSHAGYYTCSAANSVGDSEPSTQLHLEVLYGVQVSTISKKEQKEGTQLSVNCSGQSYPAVTDKDVKWTKQNNVNFSMKGEQLVIDNVNRVDSGIYVCSVVIKLVPSVGMPLNVTGRTTVEVDVVYPPAVKISPNYGQYNVLEHTTDLELVCTVTNTNPAVTSYKWFKDGSLIEGSTNSLYTISTVRRSHTGKYTCAASNSVGTSDPSSAIQINVLYGVDMIPIDQQNPTEWTQLSISCKVISYPKVTNNDVTWTKQNNATFYRKGQQLVIGSVDRMDNGTFVCSVEIKFTPTLGPSINVTGTTTVEVNVFYRPTVTVFPNYNHYNVVENTTNLQLTCQVEDANPSVTSYRWYKDSSVISNKPIYTISTVHRTDNGSYTCDASNTVGTSSSSSILQLNILYGVELYPIKVKNQTEGNPLKINCEGKSYPMLTENDVKWSKQNNDSFSSQGLQLIIDNVNRLDRGIYVCSVVIQLTPTVGQPVNVTGRTAVEVEVLYRPDVTVSPDENPYSVIENKTNLHLTCNVIDTNPAVTSYRWYKNGAQASSGNIYTIPTVFRSHTGNYTCDATNMIGTSVPSSVLQLDVLYGVSLKLSAADIGLNETERWELSCIGDGNPTPKLKFVYGYNRTTVSDQKASETSISVKNANCMDTGVYVCSGNNTIGEPMSQSADIKVFCKPRTYNNVKTKDIFINGTDESLNISTTFISFPFSDISWSRELPDGNWTDLDSEFILSTIPSDLPYETISILQKEQLKQEEFGFYLVKASNMHGSFLLKYHIISKRVPDQPTDITASCDMTSIRVTWISRFNGGGNQTFRINFVNNKSNRTISNGDIADKGRNELMVEDTEFLNPDTLYSIYVDAQNVYGTTSSTEIVNCTTTNNEGNDRPVYLTLVGGIAGSISALLIVVFIIGGLYFWRRRKVPGGDNELIKRGTKETDEEEEGLKENPLYVTSGETTNAEVEPVYGVINKGKQKKGNITFDDNNDQGPVYSQVQKSNTKGVKKHKKKKETVTQNQRNVNCKDFELGTVYENSDKVLKYKSADELYLNAGEQGIGLHVTKEYCSKKNKDGLIYADLDLIPGPSGTKFIIRGLENRTNYAIIDLSIKADPLPSDDDDNEDSDNINVKSPGNTGNE